MNTVIKPPWIDDDEYLDFLQSCQKFQFFSKKYQNHPLIENFSKSKAVLLIYCSNKLENTLPTAKLSLINYCVIFYTTLMQI